MFVRTYIGQGVINLGYWYENTFLVPLRVFEDHIHHCHRISTKCQIFALRTFLVIFRTAENNDVKVILSQIFCDGLP